MSILIDIPERKQFEYVGERRPFKPWIKYVIAFVVIICLAALVFLFFKGRADGKAAEREQVVEKLPVVADLPMKPKPSSEANAKEAVKPTKTR